MIYDCADRRRSTDGSTGLGPCRDARHQAVAEAADGGRPSDGHAAAADVCPSISGCRHWTGWKRHDSSPDPMSPTDPGGRRHDVRPRRVCCGAIQNGASGSCSRTPARGAVEAVHVAVNGDALISPSVTVRFLQHFADAGEPAATAPTCPPIATRRWSWRSPWSHESRDQRRAVHLAQHGEVAPDQHPDQARAAQPVSESPARRGRPAARQPRTAVRLIPRPSERWMQDWLDGHAQPRLSPHHGRMPTTLPEPRRSPRDHQLARTVAHHLRNCDRVDAGVLRRAQTSGANPTAVSTTAAGSGRRRSRRSTHREAGGGWSTPVVRSPTATCR